MLWWPRIRSKSLAINWTIWNCNTCNTLLEATQKNTRLFTAAFCLLQLNPLSQSPGTVECAIPLVVFSSARTTDLEAQQPYSSYRAILVTTVSQNYLVFCFCGASHNYRAICCKMGYRTDVPAWNYVPRGISHHLQWGAANLPERFSVSRDTGYRNDNIAVSRGMGPLRQRNCTRTTSSTAPGQPGYRPKPYSDKEDVLGIASLGHTGKTPETLSERFLEFPSRVRLGSANPYNKRHLRLPEHFQHSLQLSMSSEVLPERASQSCCHGIPSSTEGIFDSGALSFLVGLHAGAHPT